MTNPLKNKKAQKGFLYTSVFALSVGMTFWITNCVTKPSSNKVNNLPIQTGTTETPGDKLLNSIFNYEAMSFDADINILLEDNTMLKFNLDGQAQIKELEDIKLVADVDANLDGTKFNGKLGYFGDTLSFSLEDVCYFKLETKALTDFITMVPTYGVTFEVPDSLSNLSLDDLTSAIAAIAPEDKKTTPQGNYYYNLAFGEGEQAINVMVLTDTNDFFKGIRIDTFYYQGTKFSINAVVDELSAFGGVNPLTYDTEGKYQDFSPAFTLFDVFYDLTKKEQLGLKADIVLENKNKETELFEETLNATFNVNMNVPEETYGINTIINENARTHTANFAYLEKTIYAQYHNVAVSIGTQTISDLVTYVIRTIGEDTISNSLKDMMAKSGDLDIAGVSNSIKNMLKNVSVSSNNLNVTIDLTEFGLENCTPITLGVDFSNETINRIYIERSQIQDIAFSIEVTFVDYVAPVINKDAYVSLEPALVGIQAIVDLLDNNRFRLEIDADMVNDDPAKGNITIDGGVQFALDPNRNDTSNEGFGYGQLTIVDGSGYNHKIEADMKSVEEILLSYNDTLNAKFNIQTLKDMFVVIKDVVQNPDDHFLELFGELLEKFQNSPLSLALAGDYGLLFDYDIVSNLQIASDGISFDINFAIFGMEDVSAHVSMTYEMIENEDGTYSYIFHNLGISDVHVAGMTISANITLKEFDDSLESTRLDPSEEYLDFSDIKVLLELGINTSKFNYYHFTANVNATLTAIGINLKDIAVPMDIKIRNNHGKVQVAVEIDVPIIKLLGIAVNGAPSGYYSPSDRHVSLYYTSEENYFYINRTEKVKTALIFGSTKTYQLRERLTTDYFLDNILDILMGDVFGFGDTIMNLIDTSASGESDNQINYEKILTDFQYNKHDHYFEFGIDVNELANTTVFTATTLKVYTDSNDTQLTGISVTTGISVGLKINLSLNLTLANASIELTDANVLTKLESHISTYSGDALNTKIVTTY